MTETGNSQVETAVGNPQYFDKLYWGEEGPQSMLQFFKQYLKDRKILRSNYLRGSYDEYDNDGFWQDEIDALQKYVPPEGTVAEIGCGYGHLVKRLIPLFKHVYGMDISTTALVKAREKSKKHFLPQGPIYYK